MGDVKKLLHTVTGGLFESPDLPEIPDPALAPDPEDLAGKRAKEKDIKRRKAGGRVSTILSENSKLG
jgi:hypothetical protein